jgi:hypothetical protein
MWMSTIIVWMPTIWWVPLNWQILVKNKIFIYYRILKTNDFSLTIFMHFVVLNHIWKKVVNKFSFNLISFKMQELITNFHYYNHFQWKMVPYFQLNSCLEFFPSIPNDYSGDPLIFFPLVTHSHVFDFFNVSSPHYHFYANLFTMFH